MADSSSSSPSQSDAQIEETLDRMLTRLALADDSNLSSILPKILPYSISSLSSSSQSIRKLVKSPQILGFLQNPNPNPFLLSIARFSRF